jgi:hypothetical protein
MRPPSNHPAVHNVPWLLYPSARRDENKRLHLGGQLRQPRSHPIAFPGGSAQPYGSEAGYCCKSRNRRQIRGCLRRAVAAIAGGEASLRAREDFSASRDPPTIHA